MYVSVGGPVGYECKLVRVWAVIDVVVNQSYFVSVSHIE